MADWIDSETGKLRRGPGRVLGRKVCGDSRFERACFWVGPRAHRWGYNVQVFLSWVPHPIEFVRTWRR